MDSKDPTVNASNKEKKGLKRAVPLNVQSPSPTCAGCCGNGIKSTLEHSKNKTNNSDCAAPLIGGILSGLTTSRGGKDNAVRSTPNTEMKKPSQAHLCISIERSRLARSEMIRNSSMCTRDTTKGENPMRTKNFSNGKVPK